MSFASATFLAFLALVFGAYWSIRDHRRQNALLIVASYAFYGWWDVRFCLLMLVSSLVDYWVGLALAHAVGTRKKRLLGISLTANLGLLGVFKYFDFFAENLSQLAQAVGFHLDPFTLNLVLPVGISFYTFQTLSYTIDIYRGRLAPHRALVDYLAFVSFFPQLVAGPIERAKNLLPQFARPRRFSSAEASDGCRLILWGLLKKMVLADNLAPLVEASFADPGHSSGPRLILATVAFAFQIYCDFSGYSDIAIGTARLFGIRLMRNFAYPYFSQSVAEFWRRWHISLSTWFRDYLFIPLGGSRVRGRVRLATNILTTFAVSGLWHGASWKFVVWGAINGLAILPSALSAKPRQKRTPDETPGGQRPVPSLAVAVRIATTFCVTCVAWVFFRATDVGDAFVILWRCTGGMLTGSAYVADPSLSEPQQITLIVLCLFVLGEWIARRHLHPLTLPTTSRATRWLAYSALVWFLFYHGTRASEAFIYFQF